MSSHNSKHEFLSITYSPRDLQQLLSNIKSLSFNSADATKIDIDILLGHQDLSPIGLLDDKSFLECLDAILEFNLSKEATTIRPVLAWDILMTENEFHVASKTFLKIYLEASKKIPDLIVRVEDPGALQFVLEHPLLKQTRLQFAIKSGGHNIESLLTWENYCLSNNKSLDRIILSSEIPRNRLEQYCSQLKSPVEVLGLGPIQLFHSPRKLVSNYLNPSDSGASDENSAPIIEAIADCEENTHKDFRVVETRHGTIMFHSKDYSLIDRLSDLKAIGVRSILIDGRLDDQWLFVPKVLDVLLGKTDSQVFLNEYPHKVTRCFYQANATDVLFKKLKNTSLQRKDQSTSEQAIYVGYVAESRSKQYTVIYLEKPLSVGTQLFVTNPQGDRISFTAQSLRNINGTNAETIERGQYALLPYITHATTASGVYCEQQ